MDCEELIPNPLPFYRSAVYSDRFRTCRLSRYNQKDGMRIIYDADYDYYENLMCKLVTSGFLLGNWVVHLNVYVICIFV